MRQTSELAKLQRQQMRPRAPVQQCSRSSRTQRQRLHLAPASALVERRGRRASHVLRLLPALQRLLLRRRRPRPPRLCSAPLSCGRAPGCLASQQGQVSPGSHPRHVQSCRRALEPAWCAWQTLCQQAQLETAASQTMRPSTRLCPAASPRQPSPPMRLHAASGGAPCGFWAVTHPSDWHVPPCCCPTVGLHRLLAL